MRIANKPMLKWAGGKRWLVQSLLPLWENFREYRLVEPFCGGLSVTLGLSPNKALLNDINPHLINFYKWVSSGLVFEIPMENESSFFYAMRSDFNKAATNGAAKSKKSAELFYYLNRTCFNGLCRFNRNGEFNVPFGQYTRISYAKDFLAYKEVLSNWKFQTGDFQELRLSNGDFVFADPPYDVNFTNYSGTDFGWKDQIKFAEWIAGHDGPTVITNQATSRIVNLYTSLGFDLFFVDGPLRIHSKGNRTPANVVVAYANLGTNVRFLEAAFNKNRFR